MLPRALRQFTTNENKIKEALPKMYETYFRASTNVQNLKVVKGPDLNKLQSTQEVLESYESIGNQANNFQSVVNIINEMLDRKLSSRDKTKIILAYNSCTISCGLREVIRYIAVNNMVDALVTTAGGVDEDFMKGIGDSYVGEFTMPGDYLRRHGWFRTGNTIFPYILYYTLNDLIFPLMDDMLDKQKETGVYPTPSELIAEISKHLGYEDSAYYWATKNGIPVFCPVITDGGIGDALMAHSYMNPGLRIDVMRDTEKIYKLAGEAETLGVICLGGGLAKHHALKAAASRGGADLAAFINTGNPFDSGDSGQAPSEAITWGGIKPNGRYHKLFGENSTIFPLITNQTFMRKLRGSTPI